MSKPLSLVRNLGIAGRHPIDLLFSTLLVLDNSTDSLGQVVHRSLSTLSQPFSRWRRSQRYGRFTCYRTNICRINQLQFTGEQIDLPHELRSIRNYIEDLIGIHPSWNLASSTVTKMLGNGLWQKFILDL